MGPSDDEKEEDEMWAALQSGTAGSISVGAEWVLVGSADQPAVALTVPGYVAEGSQHFSVG